MLKLLLRPTSFTIAFAACLFAVVVGLKWATFDRFGSAMPDWDQWDAEALNLLAPWFEHDHFAAHLFQPHNEHRVVITKLQNLTLTLLNGQWDARLEAVANALLHGALAVALWLLGRRRFASFTHAPLWLLSAALFGLPLAWQNILGGFHSQQYWLLVTSFAAVVVLPFARPWSAAWWAGIGAATLALFTMGSGLLAAAVVLVMLGFQWLRGETKLRAAWPTLIWCVILVAAGALTRVEVEYHAQLKAKTAHDFFFSLVHSLQWPVPSGFDALAGLLWLPWLIAAWCVFTARRGAASVAGQILVGLGGWVLVQLVATAYARGAGADFPASRYMDTLTFGAMVNGLTLAWLFSGSLTLPRWRLAIVLAAAWVLTLGFGLRHLLDTNLNHELPDARRYYDKAETHMRGYLATDDPAQLAFPDIPYPSAGGIIERLARPSVRALMAAVIRAPLAVKPAAPGPFLENRASALSLDRAPHLGLSPATGPLASAPTWGSFDPVTGLAATGEWRSAPVSSPLGAWLKFETAGQPGESALIALELRDAKSDTLLATVRPTRIPGDTWRAAYVRAPRIPFVIVARDRDSARWLAFSAPVEMGHLSWLAWRATQHGLLIAQVAGIFAVMLFALTLVFSPRPLLPAAPATVANDFSAPLRRRLGAFMDSRFPPDSTPFSWAARLALALSLFLAVWGAKLMAIDHYGSDLPYWDQWAKEGDLLLTPWFERHELWHNLFLAHNEHRIAPTLALNLALVTGGGQWDARVQCVASAALHATVAAGLFVWALRRFRRRWALVAGGVLLLATAPPIAWENVLGGFQSQFYFLAGFSLLALGGLLAAPSRSWRWWGGLGCGLLSLVSMGSGLLIAAPIVAFAAVRLALRTGPRRDALLTLLAGGLIGGLGLWLRTPAPWHETIHAHTLAGFLLYATRCLSWPLPQHPWLAPLIWLPWIVLAGQRLRTIRAAPEVSSTAADFIVAAGGWVLLQVAAVSYSRAGGGDLPASRYGDIAAFGLIVCFLALAQIACGESTRRLTLFIVGGIWCALAATCIALATRDAITGPLPAKKAESLASEQYVHDFILTDDFATFEKQRLTFPLPDWLARILRRPDIRAVLPTSVRAPLAIPGFSFRAAPPAPDLLHRRTQIVADPAGWRSASLPAATFAWWKIETTGPAFAAESTVPSLQLTSAAGSVMLAPTKPPSPGEWRAAYAPAPRGSGSLVAHVDSPDRWLAFSEPVEMSALSYRTWQLVKQGIWVCAVGVLGLLILGAQFAFARPALPLSRPARFPEA